MTIYYNLFIYWIFACGAIKANMERKGLPIKHNSKVYFYIAGLSLYLLMALRDVSVGTDLPSYILEYKSGIFRTYEPGFSYFNILLNKIGVGTQLYIAITAVIVISAITLLYYRYSKDIALSYYLYVTIGFFAMSMSGIRQSLATCLTIFAFILLMKNKRILFFIFVGGAYLFHNSALVFMLVYFLRKVQIKKKTGFIVFGISIFLTLLLFKKWIIIIITYISPNKYLKYLDITENVEINPLVIAVSIVIPLVCLFFWTIDKQHHSNEYNRAMSSFLVFSCANIIINILALDIKLFRRLIFYFVTYNTVLIPNVIQSIKDKNIRKIAKLACIILPLIHFLISTPGSSLGIDNYKFFWE